MLSKITLVLDVLDSKFDVELDFVSFLLSYFLGRIYSVQSVFGTPQNIPKIICFMFHNK